MTKLAEGTPVVESMAVDDSQHYQAEIKVVGVGGGPDAGAQLRLAPGDQDGGRHRLGDRGRVRAAAASGAVTAQADVPAFCRAR